MIGARTCAPIVTIVAGLCSSLLIVLVAVVPLNILFGKLPNASVALVVSVLGSQVLPIILPGAAILALAWRLQRQRLLMALALLVAPLASLSVLFVVLLL